MLLVLETCVRMVGKGIRGIQRSSETTQARKRKPRMKRAGGPGCEDLRVRAHAHLHPSRPAHYGSWDWTLGLGPAGSKPESEHELARYPPGVLRGSGGTAG